MVRIFNEEKSLIISGHEILSWRCAHKHKEEGDDEFEKHANAIVKLLENEGFQSSDFTEVRPGEKINCTFNDSQKIYSWSDVERYF